MSTAAQHAMHQESSANTPRHWDSTTASILQLIDTSLKMIDAETERLLASYESETWCIESVRDIRADVYEEEIHDGCFSFTKAGYDAAVTDPYQRLVAQLEQDYSIMRGQLHAEQARFLKLKAFLLELK